MVTWYFPALSVATITRSRADGVSVNTFNVFTQWAK